MYQSCVTVLEIRVKKNAIYKVHGTTKVVNMGQPTLTQTVENEYVRKNSVMSGTEVLVPKDIYDLYTQNNYNTTKPKFGCSFPGGYITARGGVFKSHRECDTYTFIRAFLPIYDHRLC